jgi:hypothetical protein
MESPGHQFAVKESSGEIFVGSLTGNVLRWSPFPEWSRSHGSGAAKKGGKKQ